MRTEPKFSSLACVCLAFAPAVVGVGCAAGDDEPALALLRAGFPDHVESVLGSVEEPRAGGGLVAAAAARGGLSAAFPATGDRPVRLSLVGGPTLEVREIGLSARARMAGQARVYGHARGGGASWWRAHESGIEEWLLVRAPAHGPVAEWHVDGGALRQSDSQIEILDSSGRARLRVSAPAAFARGGAPVAVKLGVRGARLVLEAPGATAGELLLVDPLWQVAGAMLGARDDHTMTVLPSGKVLIVGGGSPPAELYDPATGTSRAAGAPLTARSQHTATMLPTGKVLILGGYGGTPAGPLASAEVYDPATDTFAAAGALVDGREGHTATLLPSGKVLVVSGQDATSSPYVTAELFDPATGASSYTGSLLTARYGYAATLLPSGKVLVAAGRDPAFGGGYLASAELYDPGTGTFAATGSLVNARSGHTATVLRTGKVLVAGGYNGSYLTSAELYDPTSGTFSGSGALQTPRSGAAATLLPSGKVVVAGGCSASPCNGAGAPTGTDVYDPGVGTFSSGGSLATGRAGPAAVLLPSGRVLVAGGSTCDGCGGSCCSPSSLVDVFELATGRLTYTGGLTTSRDLLYATTTTLLPSGKVLVAGGDSLGNPTQSAELYDPATGAFQPTGSMGDPGFVHTATRLLDGRVLIVCSDSASPQLYQPSSGTFVATGVLATPRSSHSATLLPSGKVLIVGGQDPTSTLLTSVESYDPASGQFAPAGAILTGREGHAATLLPSGKVLLVGGNAWSAGAELFDPLIGTSSATGPMVHPGRGEGVAVAPLVSGKVLIGGAATPELYDPETNTFASVGSGPSYLRGGFTVLPSGRVLMVDDWTSTIYLYDPLTNAFVSAGSSNALQKGVLLASGQVLFPARVWVDPNEYSLLFEEPRDAQAAWTPTLTTPLPTVLPGNPLDLAGTRFVDGVEGSFGTTQSSSSDYPLLVLLRLDSQALGFAPTRSWTATAVTATVPATMLGGNYLAWLVHHGVLSAGAPLTVTVLAKGATCANSHQCASGVCVDGRCCDSACGSPCDVCAASLGASADGTCTVAPAGYTGSPTCGPLYACNGTDLTCPTECYGDADCATDHFCGPGRACALRIGTGGTCNLSADCRELGCRECQSGHCVQGVCCDAACAGGCHTCVESAGAPSDGVCTVLPAGHAGLPVCAPFVCDGVAGACPTECTGDAQCATGFFCADDHMCRAKHGLAVACTRPGECQSDACADGICCDTPCADPCKYCKVGIYTGTCMDVVDGTDPRHECQASTGGSSACAGKCQGGQCAYPDVGTGCGLCAACDGTGRCTQTPDDDDSCGTIACGALDSACRSYQDLTASRCASLGACKPANDPGTCTAYTALPCADGGPAQADGGAPDAGGPLDAGGGGKSGGCALASADAPGAAAWLAACALCLGARRRRRAR